VAVADVAQSHDLVDDVGRIDRAVVYLDDSSTVCSISSWARFFQLRRCLRCFAWPAQDSNLRTAERHQRAEAT